MENIVEDYEGSYGKKLEDFFIKNREKLVDMNGMKPEDLAAEMFKRGRRVTDGDTYDTWAERNKINLFTENANRFNTEYKQSI